MPAILVGMFCIIEMVMVLLSGQVIVKLTLMAVVFLCIGIFYRIVERRIQYSWILLVVTFLTTFSVAILLSSLKSRRSMVYI